MALSARGQGADVRSKLLLAGLRIVLVLLAMFMLSEAVLSVERTGLPYLTILIDDSASERIADQYEKPEVKAARRLRHRRARRLRPAKRHRLAHRQGADPEGQREADPGAGEAAQGPALSSCRTRPDCSPRSIVQTEVERAMREVRAVEADR